MPAPSAAALAALCLVALPARADDAVVLHSSVDAGPPVQAVVLEGSSVSLRADGGSAPLPYHWQQKFEFETDWRDLASATSASVTVRPPAIGPYCLMVRCVFGDTATSPVSDAATLVPKRRAPVFADDLPADVTVRPGEAATLRVRFADDANVTYLQWSREGQSPEAPNGERTFSTGPLQRSDDGSSYFVVATNVSGNHVCGQSATVQSHVVTVHVQP